MEENNNLFFTENQRDKIYTEMLMPLKAKISQILLYDTEAAMEFLKQYNEIIENEGNNILRKIVDLEGKIAQYEATQGKDKITEEKERILLNKIEDLKAHSSQLSPEEMQDSFAQIFETYKDTSLEYKNREIIERSLYELKSMLIVSQIYNGNTNVREYITPEDKPRLIAFINSEIYRLEQSNNPNTKKMINEVKSMMINEGDDCIYDAQMWKSLDAARKGIIIANEQTTIYPNTETALALTNPPKHSGLFRKLQNLFKKEPTLPLQVDDIPKITIDWLAKQVPTEMLKEIEKQKLKLEGKDPKEKYIPDPRVPIYQFFYQEGEKLAKDEIIPENWEEKEYEYIAENGQKHKMIITELGFVKTFDIIGETGEYYPGTGRMLIPLCVDYAEFLDNILGTNLKNSLLVDTENGLRYHKPKTISEKLNNLFNGQKTKPFSMLYALRENYSKLNGEYIRSREEFNRNAEYARKKFYVTNETSKFREQYRVEGKTGVIEQRKQTSERRALIDKDEIGDEEKYE